MTLLILLGILAAAPIGTQAQSPVQLRPPLDGSPRTTSWVGHQCAKGRLACQNFTVTVFTGNTYTNCADGQYDDWRGPYCQVGHAGIDYSAARHTQAYAAAAGQVTRADWDNRYPTTHGDSFICYENAGEN